MSKTKVLEAFAPSARSFFPFVESSTDFSRKPSDIASAGIISTNFDQR